MTSFDMNSVCVHVCVRVCARVWVSVRVCMFMCVHEGVCVCEDMHFIPNGVLLALVHVIVC